MGIPRVSQNSCLYGQLPGFKRVAHAGRVINEGDIEVSLLSSVLPEAFVQQFAFVAIKSSGAYITKNKF